MCTRARSNKAYNASAHRLSASHRVARGSRMPGSPPCLLRNRFGLGCLRSALQRGPRRRATCHPALRKHTHRTAGSNRRHKDEMPRPWRRACADKAVLVPPNRAVGGLAVVMRRMNLNCISSTRLAPRTDVFPCGERGIGPISASTIPEGAPSSAPSVQTPTVKTQPRPMSTRLAHPSPQQTKQVPGALQENTAASYSATNPRVQNEAAASSGEQPGRKALDRTRRLVASPGCREASIFHAIGVSTA